jgi:hypothetical protein
MQIELAARLNGRTVRYPKDAAFKIDQKIGKKPYRLLSIKKDIGSALYSFATAKKPKALTRLRAFNTDRPNGKHILLKSQRGA